MDKDVERKEKGIARKSIEGAVKARVGPPALYPLSLLKQAGTLLPLRTSPADTSAPLKPLEPH